jgi:hypothetical protein
VKRTMILAVAAVMLAVAAAPAMGTKRQGCPKGRQQGCQAGAEGTEQGC